MKATQLLLAAALFTGLAALSIAGPGPQYWSRTKSTTPVQKAEVIKTADLNAMACAACKTTAIEEFKSTNPNGRPPLSWVQTGTKHDCAMCGGSIVAVKGKTTDTMGYNCKMCSEVAPVCCVATPNAPATKS